MLRGDSAVQERAAGFGKHLGQVHRVVFGEAMAEEPTVEQHPIGYVPDDEQ